ncbi:hypothetical protein Tco_1384844 [Tanacetum coccineum]
MYSNPMIQPEPEGSTQGYPLVSVEVLRYDTKGEVLRFYTLAGNPVKKILLKLNLPDHRILKDGHGEGPFKLKAEITVPSADGTTEEKRTQTVDDLSPNEKLRYKSDIKAVNILLLGLPVDIYILINHYQTTKERWDWVKELMEGT